jgi:phosphopantethiene--protein transferase domain
VIKGVGIDIVSVERIGKVLENYGEKFIDRILTESEKSELKKKGNLVEFLAGRFAAKEAITKTLEKSIPFNKIEITYNDFSKPIAKDFPDIYLSISHEKACLLSRRLAVRVEI